MQNLKGRMMFLNYYWETMKVDMSRLFNTEINNGKQVSVKVFAISTQTRELYMKAYINYCRYVYIYHYTAWRIIKIRILDLEKEVENGFDWK